MTELVSPDLDSCIALVRLVVDVADAKLDGGTLLSDVEGWDSLTMVRFILAVKKKYRISLNADDIRKMLTIGDMPGIISKRF